jgi:hypothetical protein
MTRFLAPAGVALTAALALSMASSPAHALVSCNGVGVPRGCVVRPVAPVARLAATPGVGARGVGIRAGTPMNRGGPVNRIGRR